MSIRSVALVTGGTSGIGLATVRELIAADYCVAATGRNAPSGARLVAELGADRVSFEQADLVDPGSGDRLVSSTVSRFGRLDALVNNAGICEIADALETTDDLWRRHMAINLDAAFFLSRAAVRQFLMHGGGGSIVNVASGYGLVGAPSFVAYCASKGAMVLMTKAMALDHARQNVRVNCICPGAVDTPMNDSLAIQHGSTPEDARRHWADDSPNGRIATPEDCARAITFLLSNHARQINGVALPVDGGVTARF